MFVRKKKNRSGSISIVIIDKSGGKSKELHTIGVAYTKEEEEQLEKVGRDWIYH